MQRTPMQRAWRALALTLAVTAAPATHAATDKYAIESEWHIFGGGDWYFTGTFEYDPKTSVFASFVMNTRGTAIDFTWAANHPSLLYGTCIAPGPPGASVFRMLTTMTCPGIETAEATFGGAYLTADNRLALEFSIFPVVEPFAAAPPVRETSVASQGAMDDIYPGYIGIMSDPVLQSRPELFGTYAPWTVRPLQVATVPTPGSFGLMALGLLFVGGLRRWRPAAAR